MLIPRIIPCLLLQEGGLVKTMKFKSPKYVGDPMNVVKIFNDKEVDELIFIDIDASRLKREPNYSIIKDIAEESFMPLSYGGGIKTLKQIEKILHIGVEKVVINHASLLNSTLISDASNEFGSSTIIAAVDLKKNIFGNYFVYNHVDRKNRKGDYLEYIQNCVENGAGEIFINDVDRDGLLLGYDLELHKRIAVNISVPIISCGGASRMEDFDLLLNQTEVSAAAAGSVFVFQGPHKAVLISYPKRTELEKLFKN